MANNQKQPVQFDKLAYKFINDVCAGKNNETPAAYLAKLRYLERFLTEGGYTELSQDVIDEFRTWLINRKTKIRGKKQVQGSLSPFTIRTVLTTVRHFLRWGHEQNLIPKMTIKNIIDRCGNIRYTIHSTFPIQDKTCVKHNAPQGVVRPRGVP